MIMKISFLKIKASFSELALFMRIFEA